MSRPIIEVSNLSKRYSLGQIGVSTLKEDFQRLIGRFGSNGYKAPGKLDADEFWALKGVSFDVEPGQVLGVIGRNGAGKSTLLKILSRITEPTGGEAVLRGRVASLLEVGTGFHGDLSGRENIFLNGAILGMTVSEIRKKFDEIVAFAGIEKFIDTPVKRYSSGMYVRLAFAVAAHLEPEILIIDEVLAVGDQQFQKKCLGKMQEISSGQGRTILFVSHNMNAVETLCTGAILIEDGRVLRGGQDVSSIVKWYLSQMQEGESATVWNNLKNGFSNEWFRIDRLSVVDDAGITIALPMSNSKSVHVVVEGEVLTPDDGLQIGYGLLSGDNDLLFWSTNLDAGGLEQVRLVKGPVRLTSRIPARLLNEGTYRVELFLGLYHRLWISEPGVNAPGVQFEIQGGLSDSPFWVERRPGFLGPVLPWRLES